MNTDDYLDKTFMIILITVSILVVVLIISVIICMFQQNKNCYGEAYIEYPCEGATHYARVHRNNNEACEKTKIICIGD